MKSEVGYYDPYDFSECNTLNKEMVEYEKKMDKEMAEMKQNPKEEKVYYYTISL
jgi:hypothetical protein